MCGYEGRAWRRVGARLHTVAANGVEQVLRDCEKALVVGCLTRIRARLTMLKCSEKRTQVDVLDFIKQHQIAVDRGMGTMTISAINV